MPTRTLVAIHQPNFIPWLGYFHKMLHADVFVLLDNVQFPKKGGNWINRVQILVAGRPTWITVPVVRTYHGFRMIREIRINNSGLWRKRLLDTIRMNYARAPYFDDVFRIVDELIGGSPQLLADLNIHIIRAFAAVLAIDETKIVLSSSLKVVGSSTDLLVAVIKAVGGDAYLCGGGSSGYLEEAKFADAGIELIYQNFTHPVYQQHNSTNFTPGLSSMDTFMNCGYLNTLELLNKGPNELV